MYEFFLCRFVRRLEDKHCNPPGWTFPARGPFLRTLPPELLPILHILSARRHGQNHIVGIVVYYQWPVSRAPRNDNINLPSFLWHVLHVRSSLSFNVTNGTRTHTLDIDSHLELKLCRGKQTTRTLVTWACACRHEPGHLQRFEQQPRHAD